MKILMKIIPINISIIDCENVSIIESENIKKTRVIIKDLISKIFNRQKELKNHISKLPFSWGVWLNSVDYHELLLKKSLGEMKSSKLEFFDPIVFCNSILNSITSYIVKNFNIRGYSCSFIKSFFLHQLIDFLNSHVKYGFLINLNSIDPKKNTMLVNILLVSKVRSNAYISQCVIFNNIKEIKNFSMDLDIIFCNNKNIKNLPKKIDNIQKIDFSFFNIYTIIDHILLNNFYHKNAAFLWKEDHEIKMYLLYNGDINGK